jgi:hypothetical protein
MRLKTRKKSILLISFIFCFGLIFVISSVKGASTISTIPEKDTYVSSYLPDINHGENLSLYVGYTAIPELQYHTYIYFNFSDRRDNWNKAEISLKVDRFTIKMSNGLNVSICLIENDWDENLLTWNNKPPNGQKITDIFVSETIIYNIDVTNYIAGRNNISICVYPVGSSQTAIFCYNSRERNVDSPLLIWSYPSEGITGFNLILITISIFGVITFIISWRKLRSRKG